MSMVLCFFGIENMKINCWEVEECKNAIQLSGCCCIIANSHFDLCQYKQPVTRLQSHDLCNSLQMSQCPWWSHHMQTYMYDFVLFRNVADMKDLVFSIFLEMSHSTFPLSKGPKIDREIKEKLILSICRMSAEQVVSEWDEEVEEEEEEAYLQFVILLPLAVDVCQRVFLLLLQPANQRMKRAVDVT